MQKSCGNNISYFCRVLRNILLQRKECECSFVTILHICKVAWLKSLSPYCIPLFLTRLSTPTFCSWEVSVYQLSIGSCYDSTTLRKTGTAARILTFNKIGPHGWVSVVVHCFSRSVSSLRLCVNSFPKLSLCQVVSASGPVRGSPWWFGCIQSSWSEAAHAQLTSSTQPVSFTVSLANRFQKGKDFLHFQRFSKMVSNYIFHLFPLLKHFDAFPWKCWSSFGSVGYGRNSRSRPLSLGSDRPQLDRLHRREALLQCCMCGESIWVLQKQ